MTKQTVIRYNLKGLENLQKQVGDQYRARVGIIGSKAAQEHTLEQHGEKGKFRTTGSTIDNATIGVIQEFGSLVNNIPARSFLRMPMEVKGKEVVNNIGKKSLKEAIAAGDYKKVYALLGAAAVAIVLEAFKTGGWGAWAPLKHRKGTPLVDTGQLRRAITFDVVNKSDIL